MKKIGIIVIIVLIILGIAGFLFYVTYTHEKNSDKTQTDNNANITQTTSQTGNTTSKNTSSTTNSKPLNSNTTSNNNTTSPVVSKTTKAVSNNTTSTPKVQVQNTSVTTTQNNTNTSANNPVHTNVTEGNSEPAVVELVNYNQNAMLTPSNIMVKNTTGKAVPDNILLESIKNWILQYQYQYSGFADCNGTMWSKHWLDNIPDSNLINYFIEANGQAALNGNITALQLYKTAGKSLQFAEAHPVPFPLAVAKKYITQMMIQSQGVAPDKIVFHGNSTQGGDYYVYVKGHSTPYWYVESPIGYGTGV